MDDFRNEVTGSMETLRKLELASSNSEDSKEIFSNKYKIREILSKTADKAKTFISSGNTYAALIWGFFTAKLANNFIETEEPKAEARIHLLEIVDYFESLHYLTKKDMLNSFAGLLQYTYNSLAVATDIEDGAADQPALEWLNKAQIVYQEYRKIVNEANGPECWETLSNYASTSETDTLIRSVILECSYTTTLFMLAQIYSNLKEKNKSAEFCRKTLLRQLDLDVFDPIEWAVNASTLSEFYSEICDYTSALECLLTAKTILKGKSPSLESSSGTKPWADVSRLTAEYSLRLLERGSKDICDCQPQTIPGKVLSPATYGELFNQDTKSALQEAYGENIDGLDANNVVSVLISNPKAYPEAVKIFRWTCRCISEALLYYKLDEHCSDAIELIRAHANAYAYLAEFEPDLSRKCCMQKRRVDLLEALLNELNPQYYMTSCRIIMSECGAAITALRDLNEEKLERTCEMSGIESISELPKKAKKVNVLGRRALNMYAKLLDSFLVPATQKECEFYEEIWLRNVLMAYFYSARLHSKTISAGPPRNRIKHLQLAQRDYEKMVEIAGRHARNGYKFDVPEVEIAKELITLLPAKIARIPLDD
ncbi:hypothetical protein Aperf_G00000058930 [Anoplocephala perfoliata]